MRRTAADYALYYFDTDFDSGRLCCCLFLPFLFATRAGVDVGGGVLFRVFFHPLYFFFGTWLKRQHYRRGIMFNYNLRQIEIYRGETVREAKATTIKASLVYQIDFFRCYCLFCYKKNNNIFPLLLMPSSTGVWLIHEF